jgi:hypothetical protein
MNCGLIRLKFEGFFTKKTGLAPGLDCGLISVSSRAFKKNLRGGMDCGLIRLKFEGFFENRLGKSTIWAAYETDPMAEKYE